MEPLITHLPASGSICDPTSSSYDRPTVFLDRDGTLNIDTGYCHKPEDFVFYPDVTDGLNLLLKYDYRLIVVTNQSGIGRQYYSREDFIILNSWMLKLLSDDGINILDTFYCPHMPSDGCICRKPLPGMLNEASKIYHVDLKKSYMIGDQMTDIEAGFAAGCKTVLVDRSNKFIDKELVLPNYRVNGLVSAAHRIISEITQS